MLKTALCVVGDTRGCYPTVGALHRMVCEPNRAAQLLLDPLAPAGTPGLDPFDLARRCRLGPERRKRVRRVPAGLA